VSNSLAITGVKVCWFARPKSRRVEVRSWDVGVRGGKKRRWIRQVAFLLLGLFWLVCASMLLLRFVNPPITMVQVQRLIEGRGRQQTSVPLNRIAADLQHAVIAAEDARFYEHWGLDWKQVELVAEEARETGEVPRGASTITQQLVKNLYFTTHRNPVRKVAEWVLAPLAELLIGKKRILEIYLNQAEWGPGVFGAEAAAKYHYGTSASRLTKDQAVRLAAVLPSPLRRRPARMNSYAATILGRMRQMGW
jgi:monofunctional glycosyltransferase